MSQPALPPLPKTGLLYVLVLLLMILVFYALLVASLGAVAAAIALLAIVTPRLVLALHSVAGIEMLVAVYVAALTFGWAIVRGIFARAGRVSGGVRATRTEFPHLFALIDEVSRTVGTEPFHEVFLTAGPMVGVTEEAALYLPPGLGKRQLLLGMAALSTMTLDQLRGTLAHELGHFASKGVFAGRFIHRVTISYRAMLETLGESRLHLLNPIYWMLGLYAVLYHAVAASFSRVCELYADRWSVDAYGRDSFAAWLAGAAIEDSFFAQVAVPHIVQMTSQRIVTVNVYREAASLRAQFQVEAQDQLRKILGRMMAERTSAFDSHPSLGERMRAQGVPTALLLVPPAPRLVPGETPSPNLDAQVAAVLCAGPPSAAEALFGKRAAQLQRKLSDLMVMRIYQYRAMARGMRG